MAHFTANTLTYNFYVNKITKQMCFTMCVHIANGGHKILTFKTLHISARSCALAF